jgi:Domain of unknown function (DUF4062)
VSQGPQQAVIRTPDRRLRVFASSTLGELAEERRAVSRAVSALRLTPVMFEAGARPCPPAEVYRAYLTQADVFIGLYWQRTGNWSRARISRGWRRSSTCRARCHGCCNLAERAGGDWLDAVSRADLGILAVLRGSLDEAGRCSRGRWTRVWRPAAPRS